MRISGGWAPGLAVPALRLAWLLLLLAALGIRLAEAVELAERPPSPPLVSVQTPALQPCRQSPTRSPRP